MTAEPLDELGELVAHMAPSTARAYRGDARAVCALLELDARELLRLLRASQGECAAVFFGLAREGRAKWEPATLRRRVACLRAIVARLRDLGAVDWTPPRLELPDAPRQRTKAPVTLAELRRLLAVVDRALRPDHAARLVAAVRLMFDAGLRAAELLALDLEDVDRAGGWITVRRKGGAVARLPLAQPTAAALDVWAMRRPSPAERAWFVALEGAALGKRWTARALRAQLAAVSRRILGRPLSPHDLRHAGITAALDATGGDVRRVGRWAGHVDVRMTLRYDDDRTDLSREVAELVAAQVFAPARQLTIEASAPAAPASTQPALPRAQEALPPALPREDELERP